MLVHPPTTFSSTVQVRCTHTHTQSYHNTSMHCTHKPIAKKVTIVTPVILLVFGSMLKQIQPLRPHCSLSWISITDRLKEHGRLWKRSCKVLSGCDNYIIWLGENTSDTSSDHSLLLQAAAARLIVVLSKDSCICGMSPLPPGAQWRWAHVYENICPLSSPLHLNI